MNELKRQLDSRDGAEDFRDFLLRTSDDGLAVFQLWLILNGYQKEVERYTRLHGNNDTFIKWNIKCCKALSEKYFNSSSAKYQINPTLNYALGQAYRKVRREPNERHSTQLTRILDDIFNSISLYIESKYYSIYKKNIHSSHHASARQQQPATNTNVQFFASSHQNSKHMSPSGSDFTSSDNYSSVTDFCSVIDSNDYKRIKRRNKQIRKLHLLRNVITREHHNTHTQQHTNIPRLTNDAELATKNPTEFATLIIAKLNKVIEAAEDDSILSEHLERVMKTPKDKPRRRLNRHQSKTSNTKVCDWLETTVTIPVYQFSNTGISETSSAYEYTNYSKNDTGLPLMSSDSGLSSIRIDTEVEMDDVIEDVKARLIEETEGELTTKLLYHFNGEKFIVRVPGRPPTLLSLRQKMHCRGDYRFFIKSEDEAWVEVTDDNEPIYAKHGKVAEAKIVDRIYNA